MVAWIVSVLLEGWKHCKKYPSKIKDDKIKGSFSRGIGFKIPLRNVAKKEQHQHIEEQVHGISMHEGMGEKAKPLLFLFYLIGCKIKAIKKLCIVKCRE